MGSRPRLADELPRDDVDFVSALGQFPGEAIGPLLQAAAERIEAFDDQADSHRCTPSKGVPLLAFQHAFAGGGLAGDPCPNTAGKPAVAPKLDQPRDSHSCTPSRRRIRFTRAATARISRLSPGRSFGVPR